MCSPRRESPPGTRKVRTDQVVASFVLIGGQARGSPLEMACPCILTGISLSRTGTGTCVAGLQQFSSTKDQPRTPPARPKPHLLPASRSLRSVLALPRRRAASAAGTPTPDERPHRALPACRLRVRRRGVRRRGVRRRGVAWRAGGPGGKEDGARDWMARVPLGESAGRRSNPTSTTSPRPAKPPPVPPLIARTHHLILEAPDGGR